MQIGQSIVFDLETWSGEYMILKQHESEVLNICVDPLGYHESKCIVEIDSTKYGITFSDIKKVSPANGEQLLLFK